jgi:hypothetical protein
MYAPRQQQSVSEGMGQNVWKRRMSEQTNQETFRQKALSFLRSSLPVTTADQFENVLGKSDTASKCYNPEIHYG